MQREKQLTVEVVGAGTVGGATGRALDDWGHDVVFKDVDPDVRKAIDDEGRMTAPPDQAVDADLSLVSVPTPYDEEAGRMRTDVVEDVVETLARQDAEVVAIRSTVPPTTTERLASTYDLDHYGMVPEFLFQDSAREDLESMESVVVGAGDDLARRRLKAAFAPQVSTFVEVTPTEAEFVKIAGNGFAATKISFANEMWRLADQTDEQVDGVTANPDRVLSTLRQISPWFGPDMGMNGGWPYGGHCLPKDTRGLRAWAERERQVMVPQLAGTIAENEILESYTSDAEPPASTISED